MMESMIAESMSRLGTETAFEVLARAKALERQGKSVVHLEIGEPDYDTPQHIRDAAKRALDAGATHYGPSAGLPELREAIAEHIEKTRGVPVVPRRGRGHAGGQAHHVLRHHGAHEPRGRGRLPEPRVPDLRIGDQLRRRAARADPAPRGNRLRLRPQGARATRLQEDEAHHHQFPGEPDGRRAVARGRRPHRRPRTALPRAGAVGRDLPALPLRR